jgi:hypothetical protein
VAFALSCLSSNNYLQGKSFQNSKILREEDGHMLKVEKITKIFEPGHSQ